jgi:rhodanese-related sulfurtransferase
VARKLQKSGYNKVYALKGGWKEWFRSKYPVEEK